jgi:hypothetical protein
VEVLAVVDTGATTSCLPLEVAHDLGLTDDELVEDPAGGAGVGSAFPIWRSTVPLRAGIGLFELAPDDTTQAWGPGFTLDPRFVEHPAFLLGRADFLRVFTVSFELTEREQVFHVEHS